MIAEIRTPTLWTRSPGVTLSYTEDMYEGCSDIHVLFMVVVIMSVIVFVMVVAARLAVFVGV